MVISPVFRQGGWGRWWNSRHISNCNRGKGLLLVPDSVGIREQEWGSFFVSCVSLVTGEAGKLRSTLVKKVLKSYF